jgi:uncharacterized membrane protein YgaE (UPF0421/DUF939 family)
MSAPAPATPDPTSKEPALKVGAIVAFVGAALGLGVAFGLKLTPEQTAAILGVTTFAAPLVTALWARRKVYSPARVAELLRQERRR